VVLEIPLKENNGGQGLPDGKVCNYYVGYTSAYHGVTHHPDLRAYRQLLKREPVPGEDSLKYENIAKSEKRSGLIMTDPDRLALRNYATTPPIERKLYSTHVGIVIMVEEGGQEKFVAAVSRVDEALVRLGVQGRIVV